MRIFGLAGWSGSGKTTLVEKLLPILIRHGLRVSTIKHAHHQVELDKPGKDSYRHNAAGATEVILATGNKWALFHDLRGAAEPSLDELVAHMSPVDLVLVEGFKAYPHPKIEVHRPSLGKPMLWPGDPTVVAVASDETLAGVSVPVLALDDAEAIALLIGQQTGLLAPA